CGRGNGTPLTIIVFDIIIAREHCHLDHLSIKAPHAESVCHPSTRRTRSVGYRMHALGTLVLAGLSTFLALSASAQNIFTINVGPMGRYAHIADAVEVANSDADTSNYYVFNLAPGIYVNDFPTVLRPMTIQVDPAAAPNRATLQATVPLPNEK